MQITGTHFNYYQVCKRKLWLFANCINFEQTSDLVAEGKLIHEESYPQRSMHYEEVAIDGIKVDYYDAKTKTIHEIKKSNKIERAHEWQLKYYLYIFERNGIGKCHGILEYPVLRKTKPVELTDNDKEKIQIMEADIEKIVTDDKCPPLLRQATCNSCSYYEFCYAAEKEEDE